MSSAEYMTTSKEKSSLPEADTEADEFLTLKNPGKLKPGRVYLISNQINKSRGGKYSDIFRLRRIFQKFNMEVTFVNDRTVADIRSVIKKASLHDFKELSCIVVVLVSNPDGAETLYAKDSCYSFEADILNPILENKSLEGKPKFFFVQHNETDFTTQPPILTKLPEEFFIFACKNGGCIYDLYGQSRSSMFILKLGYYLKLFGLTKSIQDIAKDVFKDIVDGSNGKRVPIFFGSLTKDFFFGDYMKGEKRWWNVWNDLSSEDEKNFYDEDTIDDEPKLEVKDQLPGRVYIINHQTFNDPSLKERIGSDMDMTRLRHIFSDEIYSKVKYVEDGTLDDVSAVMDEVSRYNFRKLFCLVIIIMSHGKNNNMICAKDGHYSFDKDILFPILRNKTLAYKPKIFFVDTSKNMDPFLLVEGSCDPRPTQMPAEIFQMNSCVEGYESYMDQDSGSLFMQTLCTHLKKSGKTKGIEALAKDILCDMKERYRNIQIPMIHSNLTVPFGFGYRFYLNVRDLREWILDLAEKKTKRLAEQAEGTTAESFEMGSIAESK